MPAARTEARVVVGGVGHLYQGDLDFGRVFVDRFRGDGVVVEEFSYGAVAVAQRLQELQPELLVLVGAVERGRKAGTVERREFAPPPRDPVEMQSAIADAVTGYMSLELVLDVAHALGALPARTVAIEVEPASTEASERLSPEAEAALVDAEALVRDEVAASVAAGTG